MVLEDSGEDRWIVHISRLKLCYPIAQQVEEQQRQWLKEIFEEETEDEDFFGFPNASPASPFGSPGKWRVQSVVANHSNNPSAYKSDSVGEEDKNLIYLRTKYNTNRANRRTL